MSKAIYICNGAPNQIKALQHDDLGFSDSLQHDYTTGKERKGHKYISREWKNGGWVYTYADKDAPVNRQDHTGQYAINDPKNPDTKYDGNRSKIKAEDAKFERLKKDETAFNKEKDKLSKKLDDMMEYFQKAANERYALNQKWANTYHESTPVFRRDINNIRKLQDELNNLTIDDIKKDKYGITYGRLLSEISHLQSTIDLREKHK